MSKRTIVLALGAILALVVGWQVAAFAAAGISGTFESNDGNTTKQTVDDWDSVTNPSDLVVKADTPSGPLDESFGQGTKEDTAVPTVVNGSIPPNKSDLTQFQVYKNKGTDGHDYLYLLWKRSNTLGSANMDFEFNQSQTKSANGVTPVRTAGDVLITFDFASGGNVVELGLLRWLTSGDNSRCEANGATTADGCWGDFVDLNDSGNADGAVSADQKLGEAAIDLTDTVFNNQCAVLGSAYLKSRSSDSFTAALKDFVPPAPVNISNCGKIVIDKVTVPSGDPQSFPFTLTGGPSNLNQSFSLTDAATPHDSGAILPGSGYSAAETVPAGWELTSATCSDQSPVTNINVSSGETVTCTFTNTKRTTNLSTGQSYTPQDTATITGAGSGPFNGTVDFELYKGTACTGTPVYFEYDVALSGTTSGSTASTTNGAAQNLPNHAAPYTIEDGAEEGSYVWKVSYSGDSNHPNATSCVEESSVTIDNDNTTP